MNNGNAEPILCAMQELSHHIDKELDGYAEKLNEIVDQVNGLTDIVKELKDDYTVISLALLVQGQINESVYERLGKDNE